MRRVVILLLAAACGTDTHGPPSAIVLVNPHTAGTVGETIDVAVRVLDADDRVVPGVALVATPVVGAVAASGAATDGQGEAVFAWTLGPLAGPQGLDVAVGPDGPAARLYVEARPGPAAAGAFANGTAVAFGEAAFTFPATVTDAFGNPVANPPIRSEDNAITVDSARWVPTRMGRTRFVLDVAVADTIDVYVHVPLGSYYTEFRVGDTNWVETGTFVAGATDPSAVCPAPAGALSVRVFAAADVRRIRTAPGLVDTQVSAHRAAAVVHVLDPAADDQTNMAMRYRPLGLDSASTCGGWLFVRSPPWRFGSFPRLADSMVITPP